MIRVLRFDDLNEYPVLRETMFKDRAAQFVTRLGWDISLTADGLEIDEFDDADAIYLLAHDQKGRHAASMRLRPMKGATLLEKVFPEMMQHTIVSDRYWESTRFCLAPMAGSRAAAEVLLAGQRLGIAQGLAGAWGIYDVKMHRIYRRLGWSPQKISEMDDPSGRIALGCWRFSKAHLGRLHHVAGLGTRASRFWIDRASCDVPIFT